MRKIALPLCLATLVVATAVAEEGMWRPQQLPALAQELVDLGLEIDVERLAGLTSHPMNAVISLGGCTASFVSPRGLVVTNHHCADGSIQYNSSEERNLLEEGFLAADMSAELPAAPGSRFFVTVEVEDATAKVLEGVAELEGKARFDAVERRQKELVAACEADPGHRCSVREYYGGLEYQLVKQLEIRDVRLVYAPPRSIGVYGGDIDNWMWPRHTGDFTFLRAYVGTDGEPADFAPDNVPYRPASHLEVSASGVGEGDLVFVVGYPGSTNRYRMSQEVAGTIEWFYPNRMRMFREWLDIIEARAAADQNVRIAYNGLIGGLNNSAKNYQGMLDGFAKSDIVERKRRLEAELEAWIAADDERRERHGGAIAELGELVERRQATMPVREMYYEYLAQRSDLVRAANTLYRLAKERLKPDAEREPGYQERDIQRIREGLERLDRRFDADVDRAFWRHFILAYAATPGDQHVEALDDWFGIDGNEVDEERLDARLDEMYSGTGLMDAETRLGWLEKDAAAVEASDDPFLRLAVALYPSNLALEAERKELEGRLAAVRPRYMAAIIDYLGSRGQPVYPDANGTLRVTYGTVKGYQPRDAVAYTPFTTLEGIVEKHTGAEPFDAPEELLTAARDGRHGAYRDPALGSVPVNFLSTVDTTGGNSGSPTLDARGELVGLLFDGNWESITASWDYSEHVKRSIHVDIRYVLWVMEELDDAAWLLAEMGIGPSS